jgi:hypothetical protein
MQIEDEVKKSFFTTMVKGKRVATVIDTRSDQPFSFDPLDHWMHVCTASAVNVDGEAWAFLGPRGGKIYKPIIVAGRFRPLKLLVM